MMNSDSRDIISQHPIGSGLDQYRDLVRAKCEAQGLPPGAFQRLDGEALKDILVNLLESLLALPPVTSLYCRTLVLSVAILRRLLGINRGFDRHRLIPFLDAALKTDSDSDSGFDQGVWENAIKFLEEATPPPQAGAVASQQTPPEQKTASISQQTPLFFNTGNLVDTSELRRDVDHVLSQELSNIHVNVPNFRQTYFSLDSLDHIATSVLERCTQGDDPLFDDGWAGWPQNPEEGLVLAWFSNLNEKLVQLARSADPSLQLHHPPRLRTKPQEPLLGSTAKRMMDIGYVGFMDGDEAANFKHHWSHVMIVGELKKTPKTDNRSGSWLHVARYAREVLAAQDSRRFVLGFTLCGSLMRLWSFDRLGGIASERFDVNQNPLEFISAVLGFLMMNPEQLGYDPTIVQSGTQRYIEIHRDGQTERLILDQLIFRQRCIVGRATTCWKAHRDGDDGETRQIFVIKDSWQYPERNEEGLMLHEATVKGVTNMAKYYHHEVVQVGGIDDDIRSNVRKGLDWTVATVSLPVDSEASSPAVSVQVSNSNSLITSQRETPGSNAGNQRKRALSRAESRPHPRKRRSHMSTQTSRTDKTENRVHRRLILQSYGKRIHEASSPSALLAGLEACINGHQSLRREAGLLHRDISINNLMINEEEEDPARRGFLIDLDFAIQEARTSASGAAKKTGTRAFMAIGVHRGVQHSFMHDLESFFWVLYWICIHYDGPGHSIGPTALEKWNYTDDMELARFKFGIIGDERPFLSEAKKEFTEYYLPLLPWVNRLRRVVFPNGKPSTEPDEGLYAKMKGILQEARESLDS
ncbi:uncharacterized protein Triagg1_519 [Trichoderma aggressivum f. europaeum]|uniref:non-specific serine/threonine protein kinase n=1 Tax=Trichoderma aggressivum f. europaeum TaxID=173218 RepID=A0AAE1INH5_9HYPO|nr:hypothetical protein Triagg1_519 [Trichoderma aggressivum f. europaeum]